MADKKSREVVVTGVESNHGGTEWGLIALTEGGKRYAITESEYSRLEARLLRKQFPELDFTQVLYEVHSDGSPIIDKDETSGRTIEMKIDVDVSEALTGLKAVQREAREATKALRELEAGSGKIKAVKDMRDIQGEPGNWDYDDYMRGMYNGLELASATLEGRNPKYR